MFAHARDFESLKTQKIAVTSAGLLYPGEMRTVFVCWYVKLWEEFELVRLLDGGRGHFGFLSKLLCLFWTLQPKVRRLPRKVQSWWQR